MRSPWLLQGVGAQHNTVAAAALWWWPCAPRCFLTKPNSLLFLVYQLANQTVGFFAVSLSACWQHGGNLLSHPPSQPCGPAQEAEGAAGPQHGGNPQHGGRSSPQLHLCGCWRQQGWALLKWAWFPPGPWKVLEGCAYRVSFECFNSVCLAVGITEHEVGRVAARLFTGGLLIDFWMLLALCGMEMLRIYSIILEINK